MKRKPSPTPDDLPSIEDARAALSSKEACARVFGPLRRDDVIDYFRRRVEIGIGGATSAATIERCAHGDEVEHVIEQAVAAPIRYLAQAAVLLKSARPGRKQSMSKKEQRIREGARRHYERMKKELGPDKAADSASAWLRELGIYLSKESILKGGLCRRKWRQ